MIKSFLSFLFGLSAVLAFGQKPSQYVALAEEASTKGEWTLAYAYLEVAHQMDSSFDVTAMYAEATRMVKNYALAKQLYAELYSRDEGKLLPDGLFWLAAMEKQCGNYEDAQRDFKKYIKRHKSKGTKSLLERAEQEIKSCIWALDYKPKEDSLSQPVVLPKLNSGDAETSPWVHGATLYYSTSKNGEWSIRSAQAETYAAEDYTKMGLANFSALPNGKGFLATKSKDGFSTIVFSEQKDFGNAISLLDYSAQGKHCTMATPGLWNGTEGIFFASNIDGGEGGYDLWWLPANKDGWGKPKNCGKTVNTPGDEVTPFYHSQALYFSSDWHAGFGGFDVFKSPMLGSTFSKPTNMGNRINTGANDYFFVFDITLGRGWLSSNREGATSSENFTTCCNDLFSVQLPVKKESTPEKDEDLVRKALLENIKVELPVRLYFHNDEPNPRTLDTTTTLSYAQAFNSYVKREQEYIAENTKSLKGEERENAEALVTDFFELMVRKGMTDLEKVCDQLQTALEAGYSLKLNVRGFASPRAESNYNLNLTKRRTMSLVNFMNETRSGYFKPFMQGTDSLGRKLEFELLPFGEFQADKRVSDDLTNQRQSIYSRGACLERKIEIESVEFLAPVPKVDFSFSEDTVNFGAVRITEANLQHDILLENSGNVLLEVDSVVAECGCTEPSLDLYKIEPGQRAKLHIGFHPFGPKGRPQEKKVLVYFKHGEVREIVLSVVLQ